MDTTLTDTLPPPETPAPALSGRALPTVADPAAVTHWILALVAGALVSGLAVFQAPGIGSALAAIVVVAAWVGVARARERTLRRGERIALCALVVLGAIPAIRTSPWLHSYAAVLFSGVALSLPMLARAKARSLGIRDAASELALAVSAVVTGARDSARDELALSGLRARMRTPLVGLLIGLPAVILFLALFASADRVFASLIERALSFEGADHTLVHALVACAVAWAVVGLGARACAPTGVAHARKRVVPLLGPAELLFGVLLVDALFLAFVGVQLIQVVGFTDALLEPGVTYANAARQGFFQLLFVTGLVIGLTPLAHLATEGAEPRPARRVHLALTVLLVLTVGVAGSALWRMSLYTDAYGLTELRLHASALMVWLIAQLAWTWASVIRGRGGFVRGTVASLVVAVLTLTVANPDGVIAQVNLTRDEQQGVDASYLHQLSADALPTIAAEAGSLSAELKAEVCGVVDRARLATAARHEQWPMLSWSLGRARGADARCR